MGPLTIPLHALHAMCLNYGEEQFAAKGSCLATFLVAIRTDVFWLESEFGPSEHRELVYRFVSSFLRNSGAHAYSFMSEIYVAQYEPGDDDQPMPADRPEGERDEMLWVSSFDNKGASFDSRYLITPGRRGKLAWLGPR